jgi:hypothetical protein
MAWSHNLKRGTYKAGDVYSFCIFSCLSLGLTEFISICTTQNN